MARMVKGRLGPVRCAWPVQGRKGATAWAVMKETWVLMAWGLRAKEGTT